jgi:hypothetical protein
VAVRAAPRRQFRVLPLHRTRKEADQAADPAVLAELVVLFFSLGVLSLFFSDAAGFDSVPAASFFEGDDWEVPDRESVR